MNCGDEERVDEICELFEASWTCELAGPTYVRDFLTDCCVSDYLHDRVLVELIQIDLERSWMSWAKGFRSTAAMSTVQQLVDYFTALPRLTDYATLFDESELNRCFTSIANCEFVARDEWGDAIGEVYYQRRFQLLVGPNKYHMPNLVRLVTDDDAALTSTRVFPLRGQSILGRQRTTDPVAYACEQLSDGNRMIVAGLKEKTVSRKQLGVQLLVPEFAIVTNLSHTNSVGVTNQQRLAPNESRLIEFPFEVRLPGRRLEFYSTRPSSQHPSI